MPLKLFSLPTDTSRRPSTVFPAPDQRKQYNPDSGDPPPAPPETDEEFFEQVHYTKVDLARFDKLLNSVQWQITPVEQRVKCFTCKWRIRNATLVPCGHRPACGDCAGLLKICPVCKGEVEKFQLDEGVYKQMTPEEEEKLLNQDPTDIEVRQSKIEQVFYLLDRHDAQSILKDDLTRFFTDFYHSLSIKISDHDLEATIKLVSTDKFGRVSADEFVKFVLTFTAPVSIEEFVTAANHVISLYSVPSPGMRR